jgi:hypothetical protein
MHRMPGLLLVGRQAVADVVGMIVTVAAVDVRDPSTVPVRRRWETVELLSGFYFSVFFFGRT